MDQTTGNNMGMPQKSNSGKIITTVVILIIIGIALFAMKQYGTTVTVPGPTDATTTPATDTTPTTGTTGTTPPVTQPVTSGYKDGSFSATGTYGSPAGTESLGVTLTLKNGVVTDASVQNEARSPESRRYQNDFISGYKQYVVGKNIDQVALDTISGSSLTPNGFNDALAKIKTEAKA